MRWAGEREPRVRVQVREQEQEPVLVLVLERVPGQHDVRRSKQRDTRAMAARPWALVAKGAQARVQAAAHVVQVRVVPVACRPGAPYAPPH